MTYSCNKWSPSVPLHFCRNSEAWLGPIKIAFVMRCCDAGYDITLWSTTPRVSSYHKLTIKYFIFILNNIDGSIISYAMTANSMAIYWYWLIITLWVTYLVLKQDYSTPNPYWPLLLIPGMGSQKQINPPINDNHSELWLFIFRSMIHNNRGYIHNCIMDIRVVWPSVANWIRDIMDIHNWIKAIHNWN